MNNRPHNKPVEKSQQPRGTSQTMHKIALCMRWLPGLYLLTCGLAAVIIFLMMFLLPAHSKLLAFWLLILSLPLSDWLLATLGPGPLGFWGSITAGIAINAITLWCAGWLTTRFSDRGLDS